MRARLAPCLKSILALAALVLPLPSDAAELYRRAIVLEDYLGRIQLRSVYGIRLTVIVDCESNPRGCPAERVYDEVVQISFSSERREVAGDRITRNDTPMGTVYLSLAFSDSDLETFRVALDDRLRRLSADAFRAPFAGWEPMKPAFEEMLTGRSESTTWACFESKERSVVGRYDREVEEGPDGQVGVGMSSRTYAEPPSPVCEEMAAAVESAAPRTIETLPAPQRLLELVVSHEDRVRINQEEEALATLPQGARMLKRQITKGISAESIGGMPGDVAYSSYSGGNGWKFDGFAGAASMPVEALDRNAWLHRFTLETFERRLGRLPQERRVGRVVLLAAYLATLPAAIVDEPLDSHVKFSNSPPPVRSLQEPRPEGPAKIDREAFLEETTRMLEHYHGPPEELIEELVARPELGLDSEGWISVVCRGDGSADYYLLPTKARHGVTNGELFCGALESRLRGR